MGLKIFKCPNNSWIKEEITMGITKKVKTENYNNGTYRLYYLWILMTNYL